MQTLKKHLNNTTPKPMEKNKTAVEWLIEQLFGDNEIIGCSDELLQQAKKLEKEQIMKAHISAGARLEDISIEAAEQYYTETYGKQQNA